MLSWNEIKDRARRFSSEWADASKEEADAKPFLVEFFNIFGISSRRVAAFEHRVKRLDDSDGYIDLLWKGMILVEMKSRGKNLDRAYSQAKDYLHGLKEHELPKYILVCDFEHFRLHNLEEGTTTAFTLPDLTDNVQHFRTLAGYHKIVYKEQDPVNMRAAELMGKLHDRLKDIGYDGHPLELYLVRLLFCLFSEDTNIFEKQQFQTYIEQRTHPDGSDLAARLQELFQVLNTPTDKRFKNLDEQLADFPFVNGKLFEELLPTASFDAKMRQSLLEACYLDWSRISPAIFGSMFQSVMNPTERRNLGTHYTSETNILKLIKPLFLDALYEEFARIRDNKNKLADFHKKLSQLKFLDPACGCGNFLIITYRELRLLELEVLRALRKTGQAVLDVSQIILVDVDQFYGIEYEEFPARIAEVAMWLTDHQMNMLVGQEFGQYFARLPLKKAATILHADALETNWQSLLNPLNIYTIRAQHTNIIVTEPEEVPYGTVNVLTQTYARKTQAQLEQEEARQADQVRFDYIIGNPPFIGSKVMKQAQRDQIARLFDGAEGSGVLDYVSGWYIKAAKYIHGSQTKAAFVSTNSIVQGEQVSLLWGPLLSQYRIKIHFAHRTFKWSNEAKGNAAVYCVIVGFAASDTDRKRLFDYEDIRGEAHEVSARNINPYLVDARDVLIAKRSNPICNVPKMSFGNMPLDGGHLLLSDEEKNELVKKEPAAEKFLKRVFGGDEFLNNKKRWCLWLVDAQPHELRQMPEVLKRIESVRKFRLASVAPSTQKFAASPALFRDRRLSESYVVLPKVNSEKRMYIPLGFFTQEQVATDLLFIVPDCGLFHFGIISSYMHNLWVRNVCGRLGNEIRYSKDIVYNNFPWPENPAEKQVKAIETAAQKVLDARAQFPDNSLADLYNSLIMPPVLRKAHAELDKAVDAAYRQQPFGTEAARMEFMFELYEKYTAGLFVQVRKGKKAKS